MADDTGAKEYTPAPVWVSVNVCRSPEVAKAFFGRTVAPQPTNAPAWVNDQGEP